MIFVFAVAVVAVVAAVVGGYAIPIGFMAGLDPVSIYLAATIGGILGSVAIVFLYGRFWDKIGGSERLAKSKRLDRAKDLAERFGAKGLGVVGPLLLGPTFTVMLGLGLGIEKRELAFWFAIGTAVTFAIYTFGIWLLIQVI